MVQAMDGLNDGFPETALARLFVGEQRSDEVIYFSLPGGRALFLAGEQTEMLYFVRTGRLGVVRREEGQDQQFLGIIKPGEPAGEMSLVAGVVHSATVIALRDSEILALPRAAFFTEARRRPDLMAELARLMILRVRETGARTSAGDPIVFGFVGVAKGVQVRRLVDQVERCIVSQGFTVTVVGAEATAAPTEWFSTVEQRHDHVLYVAEADETAWAEQCGRQVDRLFLVGAGDAPPPARPSAFAAEAMRQHRLMDLVLMHEPGVKQPSGSEAWLDAAGAARLFHLRRDDAADTARLARVLTRTSVGLVLSGGGARAYAHLGAIRALREAGSPIDFIGGTSMGGMIGAGVAAGWDDAEMDRRIRHAFVDSSPLGDIAFPIIAMTGGKTAARRILENFDEIQIADLWLPFFCVSSNLTTGHHQVHKRGGLSRALQASSAAGGGRRRGAGRRGGPAQLPLRRHARLAPRAGGGGGRHPLPRPDRQGRGPPGLDLPLDPVGRLPQGAADRVAADPRGHRLHQPRAAGRPRRHRPFDPAQGRGHRAARLEGVRAGGAGRLRRRGPGAEGHRPGHRDPPPQAGRRARARARARVDLRSPGLRSRC